MSRTPLALAALLVVVSWIIGRVAGAQAVLGPGDDATVLPRGVARLRASGIWTRFDSRYGGGAAAAAEPLGADFNIDSIGSTQIETLGPLQSVLRSLSGRPALNVSLGRTVVTLDAEVTTVPLVAELGLSSRLTVGVLVPFVRTRTTVVLRANPAPSDPNLGLNPALDDPTAAQVNQEFLAALANAEGALADSLAACPESGSARCAEFAALSPTVRSLLAGLGAVYVETDTSGFFVPIAGTDLDAALRARLGAIVGQLNALGFDQITSDLGPVAASRAILQADAQRILTEPRFGFATDELATVTRTNIGDVEVGAKLQLVNTLRGAARLTPHGVNVRAAVGAVVRLGTGSPDSPNNLVDIGTGQGQTDVELRSQWDVLLGRRFWMTIAGRYAWQLADEQLMRITPSDRPLALAYRRQRVSRDLGDYVELEASPRWALGRYFAAGAQYLYRSKAADRHTGTFAAKPPVGSEVTLDASVLDAETSERQHRVAVGVSYSTLAANASGRGRLPLEISYQHWWPVSGAGGRTPRAARDVVQLRVYTSLFGGGRRAVH